MNNKFSSQNYKEFKKITDNVFSLIDSMSSVELESYSILINNHINNAFLKFNYETMSERNERLNNLYDILQEE
jgi:L-rhamnose mutarotase